ncbi:hypothetical protein NE237_024982 [Protea cynaroides]|uniref:F-box domain-containing protein n=1 Tax=Protea cynaroides TaxID=273540 RepID=A0A9Q0JZQ2_9MAGN|nr:hypothetical protein NE237_024982 [Protea cynaroides]
MEEVKHLPCEIVSDILSRLPIECLMQFKSVCKSWFSLIEDPSFIELQLKKSKSRPHRFILWDEGNADKVLLLDRDEGRKDMWKPKDIDLEYTIKYEEKENKLVFSIFGSCNGLLCMVSFFRYGCCSMFYGIFICNPITKECLMLPVGSGIFFYDGQIGFGVDSTGKYKLIQIYRKLGTDVHDNYEMKGEIITLGENYSRCDARGMCPTIEGMVFINGVLCCIVRKPTTREVRDQPIILVFDLDDEKFHTGSLALYHHRDGQCKESSVLRIWLIEIKKSKVNQFYHCDHIRVAVTWPNMYNYFDLVSMLSNNLLLGSHLLVYCLEKKQFMPKSFVPSLVSPIAIACGMTKKDTSIRFQGLHLEVMGYSSLWELMGSCQFHPTFIFRRDSCPRCSPPSD